MREIKFRAWDTKRKWMEDYLWINFEGDVWDESSDRYDTPNQEITRCNKGDFILMQFTGLHDKNGKEIYEGDICRFDVREGGVGEPAYHNLVGQVGFSFGCYTIGDFLSHYHSIEVIGNIYENPELLEGNR